MNRAQVNSADLYFGGLAWWIENDAPEIRRRLSALTATSGPALPFISRVLTLMSSGAFFDIGAVTDALAAQGIYTKRKTVVNALKEALEQHKVIREGEPRKYRYKLNPARKP